MTQLHPYLTFNGNCKEAMQFYNGIFGGTLQLQTIGESPLSEKLPVSMKNCILHASLSSELVLIMGSDMVGNNGWIKGTNVSIAVNCTSREDIKKLYSRLSRGGHQDHPLEKTFWGAVFGDLTDRFGVHWLLNYTSTNE